MREQESRLGFGGRDPLPPKHRRFVDELQVPELVVNEAVVNMPNDGPVRILLISDWHLFAPDCDEEYVREVLSELKKSGTFGILAGDMIQSVDLSKPEMNVDVPRLDRQMLMARALLRPFADQGKLIAAVGGNHEGWGSKNLTLDVTPFMFEGLNGVGGGLLPILQNGGDVVLRFPQGGEHRLKIYHDAGAGGGPKNMAGAERARAAEINIDDPECPDGVFGGHTHGRAVITTELRVNPITGEVVMQTYAAGGTAQGTDPERPNLYLTNRGATPSLRGLPVTILRAGENEEVKRTDVWGVAESAVAFDALKFLDKIQSRAGREAAIREEIRALSPLVRPVFDQENSREVNRTDHPDIRSRAYDVARWGFDDGQSNLPRLVFYLQGTRYGCSTTDEISAAKLIDQVVGIPEANLVILRRMVDKGLSGRMDRELYLDKMVKLIKPAGVNGQILALLMDEGLREDRWKVDLGRSDKEGDADGYSQAIMTGDYIQERLPDLPLVVNSSVILLEMGGHTYRMLVRDRLGQRGSTTAPFSGLEAMRRDMGVGVDVVVGGHMPGVGVSQSEDGIVVAPGGYAKWGEMGDANEKLVPEGGQAVVFLPDKGMVFGCATMDQAVDIHRALFAKKAWENLSSETQKRIMAIGSRRRKNSAGR